MNSKYLVLLAALLQMPVVPPPERTVGIELNPDDPQHTNKSVMDACVQRYEYCKVVFTPGTYYLHQRIRIPLGITYAYFKNVNLIPCANIHSLIEKGDSLMGMPPTTKMIDLVVYKESFGPCGDFVPPLYQVVSVR